MPITRDKFLKTKTLKSISVPVPELGEGETILVRQLNPRQLQDFMALSQDVKANSAAPMHYICQTVIMCCVDADGQPLFTEDDEAMLMEHNPVMLTRIFEHAVQLVQGLNEAVDDLSKRLAPIPSGALPTG